MKHGEDEMVFNFSSSAKKMSQFVAFFTDCEHEITQLTKGLPFSLYLSISLYSSFIICRFSRVFGVSPFSPSQFSR